MDYKYRDSIVESLYEESKSAPRKLNHEQLKALTDELMQSEYEII